MATSKKLTINNLLIMWQGQSWSVVAPDGSVIARFPDKHVAIKFAEQNHDYEKRSVSLAELIPVVMHGEESAVDLPVPAPKTKLKNDEIVTQTRTPAEWARYLVPRVLAAVVIIGVIAGIVIGLGIAALPAIKTAAEDVRHLGESIFNNFLFKVAVVGIIALLIIQFLARESNGSESQGCVSIVLLLIAAAICNAVGILPAIWNWVF